MNGLGDPARLGEEGFCQAVLGRLARRHRKGIPGHGRYCGASAGGAGARERVARRLEKMAASKSSKEKDMWPSSRS